MLIHFQFNVQNFSFLSRFNMQTSVAINGMSFLVHENISRKPVLILGDSLLWGFRMEECDVISIKGARPQDLEEYLVEYDRSLNLYGAIAVVCGGNCFKEKVKNGVLRPNCSPFRVSYFHH